MKTPNLTVLGECWHCKQVFELAPQTSSLPKHDSLNGLTPCPSSNYSPDRIEYLIKTDEEALQVAEFFKNDNALRCLHSGDMLHSGACGNGERCDRKRGLLAKAFAEYYLKKVSIPVRI